MVPSPVIELNRAVALGMAFGPEVGLALTDALVDAPAMSRYHLLWAVRGDLMARAGREREASAEFARAASLAPSSRERSLLMDRAVTLGATPRAAPADRPATSGPAGSPGPGSSGRARPA
jgi:predicted RNA polymerase sigma factor